MKKLLINFCAFLSNLCLLANGLEKLLTYDQDGNVIEYVVPHAGSIVYSYDLINRLTEARYPDGEVIKYCYDCHSNLVQVAKGAEKTSYFYDALNCLVKAQFPDNSTVSYDYDLANRIIKITYPDQDKVGYVYDHRNRLVKVFDKTGIFCYEYDDETNLVSKERLPNGIYTEYIYDSNARITSVSHKKSNSALIGECKFSYDDNSNCISVEESTRSKRKTTFYSYDRLNRLIEASCSDNWFEKYTYDGIGNRLTKTTQNATIDYEYDDCNRLIRAGKTHFYYDASGNLIKKLSANEEIHLGYDPTGRLISFDNGKNQVVFGYDGEGRRISKTVNGKKTTFINDPVTSCNSRQRI